VILDGALRLAGIEVEAAVKELVSLDFAGALIHQSLDEFWTVVHGHWLSPSTRKLGLISILVNIEVDRYDGLMKRTTDPDVLLLQAAADPMRLSILRQLSAEGPVCACNFTDCCDIAQPTVSHHLRVLRTAGWVASERRGTWIYYSLRPEAVARFRELAGEMVVGDARPAAGLMAPAPAN
jgi:DNA-binding transcriptional ArsR family regulator